MACSRAAGQTLPLLIHPLSLILESFFELVTLINFTVIFVKYKTVQMLDDLMEVMHKKK